MKITATLDKIRFHGAYVGIWKDEEWYITGEVIGHPCIPDGFIIRTSYIDYIEKTKDGFVAATQNSFYLLKGEFNIPKDIVILKEI